MLSHVDRSPPVAAHAAVRPDAFTSSALFGDETAHAHAAPLGMGGRGISCCAFDGLAVRIGDGEHDFHLSRGGGSGVVLTAIFTGFAEIGAAGVAAPALQGASKMEDNTSIRLDGGLRKLYSLLG